MVMRILFLVELGQMKVALNAEQGKTEPEGASSFTRLDGASHHYAFALRDFLRPPADLADSERRECSSFFACEPMLPISKL
jgi:hypothetical protein